MDFNVTCQSFLGVTLQSLKMYDFYQVTNECYKSFLRSLICYCKCILELEECISISLPLHLPSCKTAYVYSLSLK